MIVSMVALRCCYEQCNFYRKKKDDAGGVTYGPAASCSWCKEENTTTAGAIGKRYGKAGD